MTIKDVREVYSRKDTIMENWSDRLSLVDEVVEGMDYSKKLVLAQTLENTQEAIQMMEATDAGDTSGFKHFALDLVTAIVPNLVAHEIVSVQPIDNEVGVINYIRYLYGNTKGNAQKGEEFASGLLYTGSDMYYSSQEVVGEGVLVDSTSLTATFAWTPVIKGSVVIPVTVGGQTVELRDTAKDGTLSVVDPVSGEAVEGVATTATIDYETNAIDVTLSGAPENDQVVMSYHYDNKSVGSAQVGDNRLQVPEVNIKIETMPVIAQSRKLKALYAFDAAFKLQKEYGSDINALLNSQVAAEIAHEIDGEIMEDLRKSAGLVNDTWNRQIPSGIGLKDHYESFYANLIVGSNKIFEATKRATGTFIVVGIDVASVIEAMPSFNPAGVSNVIGPHISGTIGSLTVIKNPFYPSNEYLIGYKGMSLFDAGYYYCPYMPVVTTQVVMLDDFVGRRGWATSYAKKMVQPKLYCRGEVTNTAL